MIGSDRAGIEGVVRSNRRPARERRVAWLGPVDQQNAAADVAVGVRACPGAAAVLVDGGVIKTRILRKCSGRGIPVEIYRLGCAIDGGWAGRLDAEAVDDIRIVERRGRGDRPCGRAGSAQRIEKITVVSGRDDHDDACRGGVIARGHGGIVERAEVGTERHVDDVEVIGKIAIAVRIHRPVDRLRGQVRRSAAAEYAQPIELCLRSVTRANAHGRERNARVVVRAEERRSIAIDAVAGNRAGNMRAVAVAIERVRIRDWCVRARVGVAREVPTSDDLRCRVHGGPAAGHRKSR